MPDNSNKAQRLWTVCRNAVGGTNHDGTFTLPRRLEEFDERQQYGWHRVAAAKRDADPDADTLRL